MNKLIILILSGMLLPLYGNAQLSKLMSQYHEQSCVTVTQLDKSLYGLYQKSNLPAEASEMLKNLDEVNALNLNLNSCPPEMEAKVIAQFKEVLDNPEKYKLIKSHSDLNGKQLIYSHSRNDKVSDLVVWNQNSDRLDIIELKGDLQLDKVAMLAKALNIKGLNSLAVLSPDNQYYNSYKRSREYGNDWNEDMNNMSREMQQIAEEMKNNFAGADFGGFMNDMFGSFGDSFDKMGDVFSQFGDAGNTISNSIQISEVNGKTKIKIDSKNSDITYIIDGQEAPKDNVQMPEGILNVNLIPSKSDIKKSYLFITSKDKIGEFVSYQNGMLIFKYNKQEYKYNLNKIKDPILVINGRLSDKFDTEPADILQIRPLSQKEKESGYYPNAEVVINTR